MFSTLRAVLVYLTLLVDSPSDSEGDPSVVGGRAHEADDLVVGGVEDGAAVDGHDLVAAEETAVHVRRAAGDNVPDGNLDERDHDVTNRFSVKDYFRT